VGRSSIGGINVPSIQNPSSRNQKQTDMIKDEYFNINDCNNLSLDFGEISNLTHDYYKYEQGQADIILKSTCDVILLSQIEGGVLKNGILYPLYIVSKI
jgi:hypothetical protein